jgi:ABC-2 type transport system ATP-binding protein
VSTFRLKKLVNQPLRELSAGQLTRVNLAKSFINDPAVLLLDEPTASLDPEVAKLVRDFILEEREKKNLSVIFTSHNMPEVEKSVIGFCLSIMGKLSLTIHQRTS